MTMITHINTAKEALFKLHSVKDNIKRGETYEVYGLSDREIEIINYSEASANHIIKLKKNSFSEDEIDLYNKLYGLWTMKHRIFRDAGAQLIFKKKKETVQLF